MKACVLLSHSGLSGSNPETKCFRISFRSLEASFDSIALSAQQNMSWLLSFVQHTVHPRVHIEPCWLRAGSMEHLWHMAYDHNPMPLMHLKTSHHYFKNNCPEGCEKSLLILQIKSAATPKAVTLLYHISGAKGTKPHNNLGIFQEC